ncbi:MAG: right-handed parallel beta-helix repeat-containing protein [Bacillota bacterium]
MPSCLKCGREVEGPDFFCPRCLQNEERDGPAARLKSLFLLARRWQITLGMGLLFVFVLFAGWHFYPFSHTNRIAVPGCFSTIQEGIAAARAGDTILVKPGTYHENIDFMGKSITLRSTRPLDPRIVASTVIQGNGKEPTVRFQNGESAKTVLQGLTITVGELLQDRETGRYYSNRPPVVATGGIIFVASGSAPLIKNNIITSGTAERGGAIYINASSPVISNNTISGNKALWEGGGIYVCAGAKPVINGNIFSNNFAEDGGGIYVQDALPLIRENVMRENTAAYRGGGVMISGSAPEISGNSFEGNSAGECGGGGVLFGSSPLFRQNHFSRNSGGWRGGGALYIALKSAPQLLENTFTGNEASLAKDIWVSIDSSLQGDLQNIDIFYQD